MESEENTEYDCTDCGACCCSFPIFASANDATREPLIRQHSQELAEHLKTDTYSYKLHPLPFQNACSFLMEDKLCSIYETRPSVCRKFEAGSDQCKEARKRQGIGI